MKIRCPSCHFPEGIPTFGGIYGTALHTKSSPSFFLINDDWDLFLILSGKGEWKMKNGFSLVGKKNEFVLVPPFTPIILQSPQKDLKFWYCHFAFRRASPQILPHIRPDFLGAHPAPAIPLMFSKNSAPEVWREYQQLMTLPYIQPNDFWRIERTLISMISKLVQFAISYPHENSSLNRTGVQDERVVEICQKIRANPIFPWRIEDLSKSMGLSTGHIHRLCVANLGKNLKRHIVEERLRYSLAQIQNSKQQKQPLSMKEISAQCKFSSQQFFTQQFKKFYGISPSKYQKSGIIM